MSVKILPFREPDPPLEDRTVRGWSIYDRAGTYMGDVRVSREAIRDTMPGAWVDVLGGRIVVGLGEGEIPGWLVGRGSEGSGTVAATEVEGGEIDVE